jgi:hypothetical protein
MNTLNVKFSQSQSAALQRIAGDLDETQAGVLRMALALMNLAVQERKAGNTIAIARGDRVVKEIVGLWDQTA